MPHELANAARADLSVRRNRAHIMSRNLCGTSCRFCYGRVMLIEEPRRVTSDDAHCELEKLIASGA